MGGLNDIKADVAWHLFTRSKVGRSIIIADRPIEFLSILRKQWKKMIKLLHIERARTLNTPKRTALDDALLHLHALTFTSSTKRFDADVIVASTSQLPSLPQDSTTIYLCTILDEGQNLAVMRLLRKGGLVVSYQ